MSDGPLAGVSVIELAGIGPAQHGAQLLADLGADVVRVDRTDADSHDAERATMNRGRRSIALDLKASDDLATAGELIAGADVLIDPYRPGVLERLGLGPGPVLERSPGLIYARMTGWGQEGPLASAAGHDINYLALAGGLQPLGPADRPPPVPLNLVADFGGGGMMLAFGIVAALLERERSGLGQVIDAAMVDGVASLLSGIFHLRALGQWVEGREENWIQGAAPWYRAYATADGGFVTVGPLEGKFHAQLISALGLDPAQWSQWDTSAWPRQREELAGVFAERTLGEWRERLEGTDVCFAPALSLDDAPRHEHLAQRGTYVESDGIVQPGPVPKFSRTPGRIARRPPRPGEHDDEILAELRGRR